MNSRFLLDGHFIHLEDKDPYYCGGRDSRGNPIPFDTRKISDGPHTLTILFVNDDWKVIEVIEIRFIVRNGDNSEAGILYSLNSDRSRAKPLNGASLDEGKNYYIFWEGDADTVTFFLDGSHVLTENHDPYDLAGTANNGKANAFKFRDADFHKHTLKVIIEDCERDNDRNNDNGHYNNDDDDEDRRRGGGSKDKECCTWRQEEACFQVKKKYNY